MPVPAIDKRSTKTVAKIAVALFLALGVGFWIGAISFQYKMKPYFYAVKIINRIVPFDPDKDFVYRTLSNLYRTQEYRKPVTFVGDSIVAFGKWDILLRGMDVDNHGIPGDTTRGVLMRLGRREVIGKTVIVMLGVNDLKMEISADETSRNFAKILETLQANDIILVSTLKTAIPSTNVKLGAMIESEKSVCAKVKCRFVDANRYLAPNGYLENRYTVDGVHLNWLGYRQLSKILDVSLGGAAS